MSAISPEKNLILGGSAWDNLLFLSFQSVQTVFCGPFHKFGTIKAILTRDGNFPGLEDCMSFSCVPFYHFEINGSDQFSKLGG